MTIHVMCVDYADPTPEQSINLDLKISDLRKAGLIEGWCHYVRGTYLIDTSASVDMLMREVEPELGDVRYFIAAVRPADMNGRMPSRTWDWLAEHTSLRHAAE